MERWYTNLRLIYEKGKLKTNNLNINNGIFQGDLFSLLFCISLLFLSVKLINTDYRYKTSTKKNKPPILQGQLKVICKNDDDLSTIKTFSDDIGMQFGLNKYVKVTFKKGSLIKSKNIIVDMNTEITVLRQKKQTNIYKLMKWIVSIIL